MSEKVPEGYISIQAMVFDRKHYDTLRDFTSRRANRLSIPKHPDGKAVCCVETIEGEVVIEEGNYVLKAEDGGLVVMDGKYFKKYAKRVD